jgi:predicted nucleic acid-binding protein
VLRRIDLIRVSDRVLNAAGQLPPAHLRSVDAIHLATAKQLDSDLGRLITYDQRMLEAAEELGLKTAMPR